jgi:16S rRNA (uracil1498-N3)-methyltransferase
VGPEGGLTDGERRRLAEAGAVAVRLGRTVLRIETAAVVLLACAAAWRDAGP